MKSLSDCLNFIDSMILYSTEKRESMEKLEGIRDQFLDSYNDKNNEQLIAMLPILYQTNLIIDRFSIPNVFEFTNFYWDFRRCI